jgi:phospholipid transport system substrate-binding protein
MRNVAKVIMIFLIGLSAPGLALSEQGISAPEKFVQETSDRVMNLLKSTASDSEKKKKLVSIFLDATDTDWMGKFVLGKHWQALSDQDKRKYLEVYRDYLVASYVPKFRDFNNQEVVVRGIKELSAGSYQVITDITSPSSIVRVEYRIKSTGNAYKIHDIIAEGVSLLTTQRSEFSSIMNSEGFESLINRLKNKLED